MTALEIFYWHGHGAAFFSGGPGQVPGSAVTAQNVEQINRYVGGFRA